METPNDYTIFHEYLQTACEAERKNDHAKATRILKKASLAICRSRSNQ